VALCLKECVVRLFQLTIILVYVVRFFSASCRIIILLCKFGRLVCGEVFLHHTISKCMPILLYVRGTVSNKSQLSSVDFTVTVASATVVIYGQFWNMWLATSPHGFVSSPRISIVCISTASASDHVYSHIHIYG